jgi:glycosyltransferase involved in cell wall biosynthesis
VRVLMVTDFYWPHLGGVEQHVRTLAHALSDRGHAVTIATMRTGDLLDREPDGPVDVVRLRTTTQRTPLLHRQSRPWAPPIPDPGAAWALRRLVGEFRPDVIHGHDWLARSLLPLATGSPPLVSTLHYYTLTCPKKNLLRDGRPCPGPTLARCLPCAGAHYGVAKGTLTVLGAFAGRRLEQRNTAAFVSVSRATADGNQIDTASNHHVVPNFLPTESSAADAGPWLAQLPPERFFLYVGDMRPAKGFDVLLAAYAELVPSRPLVVIGKRWPESPATMPAGVHVFENWPNHAVRAAYGRARAAVVPSVWAEPFGLVAIEAMAAGTPVIASATGGLVEIVEHYRTGLLVSPNSVDGLVAAMRSIDGDDALARRLGDAARLEAERYTAEAVVPSIEDVYESVIDRCKVRAA